MTADSPRRSLFRSPDRAALALIGVALAAVGVLAIAKAIQPAPIFFGQETDLAMAGGVLVALLLALLVARLDAFARLMGRVVEHPGALVGVVFVLLVVGSLLSFGGSPLSTDERAILFQAQLFAKGQVIAAYPPALLDHMLYPDYQNYFILVGSDGRAISVYWPGWAALMTPFAAAGVPWLLGPVSGAISAFLIGRLAGLYGGTRAAGTAIVLAGVSGAFLLTSMSVYPAAGHLMLNLAFAYLLLRGGTRNLFLAGLVGGLALILHNPVPHIAFALPWLIWLLMGPGRIRRVGTIAIGYLPGLIVFAIWLYLQGTVRVPVASGGGGIGFWLARLSTLLAIPSVETIGLRFWEIVRVWAWAAPGLLALTAYGWWKTRDRIGLHLLGLSFICTVIAFTFYPAPAGQGLGWGARYFQAAWGALPVIAAVFLTMDLRERLWRFVMAAALMGALLVVPQQIGYARSLSSGPLSLVHYFSRPGVDLMFVDFSTTGAQNLTMTNDPSLEGTLILISEGKEADAAFVERYFPGSKLVIESKSGSGYDRP